MPVPKFPEIEEKILAFWKEHDIFKKTLAKDSPQGRFVFYDGPPTANGIPHIGHVETRAFKDLIPRFKTMQGYFVERKAGWDTQGLPVELEVEKQLGLSGKKDIEKYGIDKFNAKAKASVWKYQELWEKMTERVGFWLDTEHAYVTYSNEYLETLWWIFGKIWEQKLLEQDFKVVPYCPRCGTALSSHEVAQGYQRVTETSVYIKFALVDEPKTFVLAWTTTPWTLPGNVALAVDEKIEYIKVKAKNGEQYILAKALLNKLREEDRNVLESLPGQKLVGKKYTPLFDFLDLRKVSPSSIPEVEGSPVARPAQKEIPRQAREYVHAYTIVPADFVTTVDGTGVVHTAVMYGVDDFQLGQKLDLPKIHTVDEAGKFNQLVKPWAGLEVKDATGETQREIIDYLDKQGKLYQEEEYTHDYPFCWRCKHALLYYAKTSWFIRMSKLLTQLMANNEKIDWHPTHIKDGRFGEWLREVKDWAISRERYWGTPIPIWRCDQCQHQECLSSYEQLAKKVPARNTYIFIRHGESPLNVMHVLNYQVEFKEKFPLNDNGKHQAEAAAKSLAEEKITAVYCSQFLRSRETAAIIGRKLGMTPIEDPRLNEYNMGNALEGKPYEIFHKVWANRADRLRGAPEGGETWLQVRARVFSLMHELDAQHQGQTFVLVTHADPVMMARWTLSMKPESDIAAMEYPVNGKSYPVHFPASLFQPDGAFDPHRPFIDQATYPCDHCAGGTMRRIPEVADAWFDSGAMPFAQWHYPFENKDRIDKGESYPADYICEAIDQTRGWFYTMLAVGTLLQQAKVVKEPPYKNVIVLEFIRDAKGKKLAKSLGNYVDPMEIIRQHGADAIRFYFYTASQPWEPKNLDQKAIDETVKKTFLILMNVVSFWKLYATEKPAAIKPASHVLDRWVMSLSHQLVQDVTHRLSSYDITTASRMIAGFVTDVSTWYIRRSRDRFKEAAKESKSTEALAPDVLRQVLLNLSTVMAPFTPFLAEEIYRTVGGLKESVHLEDWPAGGDIDKELLREMSELRTIVEQGHAIRAQEKIKVRQPLGQAVVAATLRFDFLAILKDELNVKEIVEDKDLAKLPDEYKRLPLHPSIAVDATLTDELKEEGMLRDLVREVNALRKEALLVPSDQIIFHCQPQSVVAKTVERFSQQFLRDIRAKAATPNMNGAEQVATVKIGDEQVEIGLSKA